MIDKKSFSFDKETIRICSYDISKKEKTTSNTGLHLLHPIVYQNNKFILLKSEALWFYIYETICDELVVHVNYQQSDVAFNLFKGFKRLILYKRYVKEYEEEVDGAIEPSSGVRREEYEYRKYKAILDFSKVSRVDKSGDSEYRYIKFIFSDKGREKEEEEGKNRFSGLMFDENLDMRIMSSIEEEERTRDKVFDIYKSKVYIDIYLEYYRRSI